MASTTLPIREEGARKGPLELDFLIVGAGPAGGSLACFLGKYGFKGLIISSAPSSANTPRAHIINQPAMECIRDLDIDMESEFMKAGYAGPEKGHTRWCETMSGREFGRITSWGSGPKRGGEFQLRSPCSHLELPQTLVEPILLRYATQHGFPCRFRTQFVSYDDSAKDSILVTVRDMVFDTTETINTKYLFGADGAKSRIVQQLGLPMSVKPSQGIALNVLLRADLTNLMRTRVGNLHYVIKPDAEYPDFAGWSIVRMVKPWHEWLFIMMYKPTCPAEFMPSVEEVKKQVSAVIGDDSIPVYIQRIDKWIINETVAEVYGKGNIFCLGDAVHRHPPMNGLGSNTCIQDAANLAWKINLVEKGLAGKSLLDTYNAERQPVGAGVVARANSSLREHIPIFNSLGFLNPSIEDRKRELAVLEEVSEKGRARRRQLMDAIDYTCHEFLALGSDMNQRYHSTAVYLEGAGDEPPLPSDPALYHEPHTFPGVRLPHAWLNTAIPQQQVSTLDLAGKGRFALFIGHGGEAWREAAREVSESLKIPVVVYSVGYALEYEAVYNDWYRLREVEEDGCVLVRPDNFIAWRSNSLVTQPATDLRNVFKSILSL
ncbi:FAD binding domain-containing protein [Xylogone sp. PMI_703]|nr:FAD binding domain-containing protein [Xylogone sp. PMI_703]